MSYEWDMNTNLQKWISRLAGILVYAGKPSNETIPKDSFPMFPVSYRLVPQSFENESG
jgi:hypothetical protein